MPSIFVNLRPFADPFIPITPVRVDDYPNSRLKSSKRPSRRLSKKHSTTEEIFHRVQPSRNLQNCLLNSPCTPRAPQTLLDPFEHYVRWEDDIVGSRILRNYWRERRIHERLREHFMDAGDRLMQYRVEISMAHHYLKKHFGLDPESPRAQRMMEKYHQEGRFVSVPEVEFARHKQGHAPSEALAPDLRDKTQRSRDSEPLDKRRVVSGPGWTSHPRSKKPHSKKLRTHQSLAEVRQNEPTQARASMGSPPGVMGKYGIQAPTPFPKGQRKSSPMQEGGTDSKALVKSAVDLQWTTSEVRVPLNPHSDPKEFLRMIQLGTAPRPRAWDPWKDADFFIDIVRPRSLSGASLLSLNSDSSALESGTSDSEDPGANITDGEGNESDTEPDDTNERDLSDNEYTKGKENIPPSRAQSSMIGVGSRGAWGLRYNINTTANQRSQEPARSDSTDEEASTDPDERDVEDTRRGDRDSDKENRPPKQG